VKVAVGLSPRNNDGEKLCVAERRLNRRINRAVQALLRDARQGSKMRYYPCVVVTSRIDVWVGVVKATPASRCGRSVR